MKTATLKQIKTELTKVSNNKLVEILIRTAKYKKENKELLTYMLFEAEDESSFIESVKLQIDEDFEKINTDNLYLAKKTIRKALRTTDKYIRYSAIKETEVILRMYFCLRMKSYTSLWIRGAAMNNLYHRQILKIYKAIGFLHEDLQFDYKNEMEEIFNTNI